MSVCLTGERADDAGQAEIAEGNVTGQKDHRDDDDHRRIDQFLVSLEAALLRIPRPARFRELGADFGNEGFDLGDHGKVRGIRAGFSSGWTVR